MAKQTRYEIIRDFETQLVYARTAFPMGTKGLQLKQGVITPNGEELQQALNLWGPAIKPGDPAHISFVQIKNDHIHFEINGGPIRRQKWYQRVQISGTRTVSQLQTGRNEPQSNPHGSYLDVYFDKYVPEMTAAQLRNLLFPVLDFNARNKEQAYLDSVPPKVKEAIQAHHVLVGMNQEMVLHAKGKPPKKVREREGETDYEEWIYGEAPADVDFVRFVGDEVVRVETMKVDGEKIVRTEKRSRPGPAGHDERGQERKGTRSTSGECSKPQASGRGSAGRAQAGKRGCAAPSDAAARLAPASQRTGRDRGDAISRHCRPRFTPRPDESYFIATAAPTSANEKAKDTFGYSRPSTST